MFFYVIEALRVCAFNRVAVYGAALDRVLQIFNLRSFCLSGDRGDAAPQQQGACKKDQDSSPRKRSADLRHDPKERKHDGEKDQTGQDGQNGDDRRL